MHDSGIYAIKNKLNGKIYVGCSKNIKDRWKAHCKQLKKRTSLINRAIQKYGVDNFEFAVLLKCPSMCFDYWEKYYINLLNSMTPIGYNLTSGGEYKKFYSLETRQKISEANKGKVISELCRRRSSIVHTGNTYTKGLVRTDEWRSHVSKKLKGVKHSNEHVENNRKAQLGKKLSDDTKLKIGIASRNRVTTEEARTNMSNAQKGRKHSEETKRKMRESQKKRFNREEKIHE